MEIQIKILQGLQAIRSDYLTLLFTVITMMAEKTFLTAVIAAIYWCIDKKKGLRLGFIVLFNGVINGMIKDIIKMPRPYERGVVSGLRLETAGGYSFPSGHTQTATSFWGGSMLILRQKKVTILGSVMILLTAFSRMYLGVHWPMDVLGGMFFGLIFTYFACEMVEPDGKMKESIVLISSIGLLAVLSFPVKASIYKAVATLWGLCFGSYMEQKYIQFKERGTLKEQVTKLVIGIIGCIVIYIGLGDHLLPDVKVIHILQNALYSLWITVGAPWLFKKFILSAR